MSISPITPGIHHIAPGCSDMGTTKHFYQNIIGLSPARETERLIALIAGVIIIVFKKASLPHAEDKVFTPFNIGLDHIALACQNEEEPNWVAKGFVDADIENIGVKQIQTLRT